jgi:hypothetical protein
MMADPYSVATNSQKAKKLLNLNYSGQIDVIITSANRPKILYFKNFAWNALSENFSETFSNRGKNEK